MNYKEYGKSVDKGVALARQVMSEGYISRIKVDYADTDNKSGIFKVSLYGKRVKRNGKNVLQLLPRNIDLSLKSNKGVMGYMVDEIAIGVAHKLIDAKTITVTDMEIILSGATYLVFTFRARAED